MPTRFRSIRLGLLPVALLVPLAAWAHGGHDHLHSFAAGALHPWSGMDHLLAMLAVGLWAFQIGGRARWQLPLAFVGVMLAGGALAMSGIPVPAVEYGILLSVLVLGLLIVTAARLPGAASLAVVGAFALFHGHAHGAEMPGVAASLPYALGFVLSTASLHGLGLALAAALTRIETAPTLRWAGSAVVAAGIALTLF